MSSRKTTRLAKAERLLEGAWDSLDPEDISSDRWEELRRLILAVKAAIKRGKAKK